MSKALGKKIGIKFTLPITGDISGNEPAFSVTGQEYQYINGPLLEKSYTVDSVERAPASLFYQEAFNGASDGVEATGGLSLIYSSSGGGEDIFDTDLTDSYGPTLLKGNVVKFKIDGTLSSIKIKAIASGAHTAMVKTAYGGTLLATGSLTASARGEWLSIEIDNALDVVANDVLFIEMQHPSGSSYVINSPRYNGTLWESQGAFFGTWYGSNYTFAMGIVFQGVGAFESIGSYITPQIPTTTLPAQVRLKTQATTPPNTSIKIEYGFGTTTPTVWTLATDLIPIGTDPLWLKYTLETTDTAVTPTLSAVWLEAPEAPQDILRLTVNDFTRFNNVEGQLTVNYNQALGTLKSTTGDVLSFSVPFTPTELRREINPNDEETIRAVIGVTLNYDLISYLNVSSTEQHTIKANALTATVEYTDVTIVNP